MSSRKAVLEALWNAELDGQIGTAKERLAALDAKAQRARRIARFKRLSIQQQSAVWRRVQLGADLETLLKEFGQ